ncbi:MAG: RNA polymerase sigma factor [Chloroflexi bacterium]|jgi:RNA polymerase sigma-70 factor (ECF subfamily)|nr:RNA polymerase sigma factor [Chloroflexota bacterium]
MTSNHRRDIDKEFEQLFADHQTAILNYLYRMVGDPSKAEELTQDAFVKAYRAMPRLPDDANVRAWLYRIATNTAYDYLRRKRLIRWLPLLEDRAATPERSNPASTMGDREAVQQGLDQLAPDYRAPLVLFSVQGYSVREIADMLGISEGAVKTRLCRARAKFREVLGENE